jgi:hypothetical protein
MKLLVECKINKIPKLKFLFFDYFDGVIDTDNFTLTSNKTEKKVKIQRIRNEIGKWYFIISKIVLGIIFFIGGFLYGKNLGIELFNNFTLLAIWILTIFIISYFMENVSINKIHINLLIAFFAISLLSFFYLKIISLMDILVINSYYLMAGHFLIRGIIEYLRDNEYFYLKFANDNSFILKCKTITNNKQGDDNE